VIEKKALLGFFFTPVQKESARLEAQAPRQKIICQLKIRGQKTFTKSLPK
jgi:hypothetical protein